MFVATGKTAEVGVTTGFALDEELLVEGLLPAIRGRSELLKTGAFPQTCEFTGTADLLLLGVVCVFVITRDRVSFVWELACEFAGELFAGRFVFG